MKSANKINYEIRPCKFAERRMLVSSLARIIGATKKQYQYIGFGALSFVDFKLFHRELHIDKMYSIEGYEYSTQRLELNKPFSCIEILKGTSTTELNKIDLSTPSIIWLDYDGTLEKSMFEDFDIVLSKVPVGSVFIVSCNRELKKNDTESDIKYPYTRSEFTEEFGNLVPFGLAENCCAEPNTSATLKLMFTNYCKRVLMERMKESGEKLSFDVLYNFKYKENRGARMYTFGGILLDESISREELNIADYKFIATEAPFDIDAPILTDRETNYLNQILGVKDKEKQTISDRIVSEKELSDYKKLYKYLPSFHDVRI